MRASKQRQGRGLWVSIEHLHIFFSDGIMLEFALPRQVDPAPRGLLCENLAELLGKNCWPFECVPHFSRLETDCSLK